MDSPDSTDWWDVLDVSSVGGLASSSASASGTAVGSGAAPSGTAGKNAAAAVAAPGHDAFDGTAQLDGTAATATAPGFSCSPAADAAEQSGGGGGGDVQQGLHFSEPSFSSKLVASTSSNSGWASGLAKQDNDNTGVDVAVAATGKGQATSASAMEGEGAGADADVDVGRVVKVEEEMQVKEAAEGRLGLDVGHDGGRVLESSSPSFWEEETAQSLREVRPTGELCSLLFLVVCLLQTRLGK